jgi:hypothetical protein
MPMANVRSRAFAAAILTAFPTLCAGQQTPSSANAIQPQNKRIFWIVPNHRASPTLDPYVPLTTAEKFKIARDDAFDPGTFALAALYAGGSQLSNANKSFGQGAQGYGKYLGASYADLAIGNFMTEGIYPTLFRQDPRYFARGKGSGWSRFGYACGQIFWTHTDSGGTAFNYSEILGNSTAVAISNAYYVDNRTASNAASRLGIQLGLDMAGNVLKEFWPDINHRFFSRKRNGQASKPGP